MLVDPCGGIVDLRRDHARLSDGLLVELHKAKAMAEQQAVDWTIRRGDVIAAGGPDVGSNESAMPLFTSLADYIAAAEGGDPAYPAMFVSSAEAMVKHTIATDDLLAAVGTMPAFAPYVPQFEQTVVMGRAAGLAEDDIRLALLGSLLPIVGPDACLALPRARLDALYPPGWHKERLGQILSSPG